MQRLAALFPKESPQQRSSNGVGEGVPMKEITTIQENNTSRETDDDNEDDGFDPKSNTHQTMYDDINNDYDDNALTLYNSMDELHDIGEK